MDCKKDYQAYNKDKYIFKIRYVIFHFCSRHYKALKVLQCFPLKLCLACKTFLPGVCQQLHGQVINSSKMKLRGFIYQHILSTPYISIFQALDIGRVTIYSLYFILLSGCCGHTPLEKVRSNKLGKSNEEKEKCESSYF